MIATKCDGAASPISGTPFTVGDVILNPSDQRLSDPVFTHASRHSNQWAAFGGSPFLPACLIDRSLEGPCNSFERSAGYATGGYTQCLGRSSSPAASSSCWGGFGSLVVYLPDRAG